MSSKREPSVFSRKFHVEILPDEYKALKRITFGEQGLVVIGIYTQTMNLLPKWFSITENSLNFMFCSLISGIAGIIFLLGARIYRGNFMFASRLCLVSYAFLIFSLFELFKYKFEFLFLIRWLIIVVACYLLFKEIVYVKNCFRENIGMGIYSLLLDLGMFFVIAFPIISWYT